MRTNQLSVLLFFLLVFQPAALAVTVTSSGTLNCQNRFAQVAWDQAESERFVFADGVMVTGGDHYPLEVVLKGLNLGENQLRDLRGKQVLSVGEGLSDLLPYMRSRGIPAQALDLWYHQPDLPDNELGKKMKDYIRKYGEHLIQGSALQMPLADNSMDQILSHMLVNNLSTIKNKNFLREALRVVKPGGQVRCAGFDSLKLEKALWWLRQEFGEKVSIQVSPVRDQWQVNGSVISEETFLLTLTKR